VTPEQTIQTADEIMHDAFGTSSKEEEEEKGQGEEGVRRRMGVNSSQPTKNSLLFLS
jgi:hypothetical protein